MSIMDTLIKTAIEQGWYGSRTEASEWAMSLTARDLLMAEAWKNHAKPEGKTLYGLPIVLDHSLPDGVVELRGGADGQIVRMQGLGS